MNNITNAKISEPTGSTISSSSVNNNNNSHSSSTNLPSNLNHRTLRRSSKIDSSHSFGTNTASTSSTAISSSNDGIPSLNDSSLASLPLSSLNTTNNPIHQLLVSYASALGNTYLQVVNRSIIDSLILWYNDRITTYQYSLPDAARRLDILEASYQPNQTISSSISRASPQRTPSILPREPIPSSTIVSSRKIGEQIKKLHSHVNDRIIIIIDDPELFNPKILSEFLELCITLSIDVPSNSVTTSSQLPLSLIFGVGAPRDIFLTRLPVQIVSKFDITSIFLTNAIDVINAVFNTMYVHGAIPIVPSPDVYALLKTNTSEYHYSIRELEEMFVSLVRLHHSSIPLDSLRNGVDTIREKENEMVVEGGAAPNRKGGSRNQLRGNTESSIHVTGSNTSNLKDKTFNNSSINTPRVDPRDLPMFPHNPWFKTTENNEPLSNEVNSSRLSVLALPYEKWTKGFMKRKYKNHFPEAWSTTIENAPLHSEVPHYYDSPLWAVCTRVALWIPDDEVEYIVNHVPSYKISKGTGKLDELVKDYLPYTLHLMDGNNEQEADGMRKIKDPKRKIRGKSTVPEKDQKTSDDEEMEDDNNIPQRSAPRGLREIRSIQPYLVKENDPVNEMDSSVTGIPLRDAPFARKPLEPFDPLEPLRNFTITDDRLYIARCIFGLIRHRIGWATAASCFTFLREENIFLKLSMDDHPASSARTFTALESRNNKPRLLRGTETDLRQLYELSSVNDILHTNDYTTRTNKINDMDLPQLYQLMNCFCFTLIKGIKPNFTDLHSDVYDHGVGNSVSKSNISTSPTLHASTTSIGKTQRETEEYHLNAENDETDGETKGDETNNDLSNRRNTSHRSSNAASSRPLPEWSWAITPACLFRSHILHARRVLKELVKIDEKYQKASTHSSSSEAPITDTDTPVKTSGGLITSTLRVRKDQKALRNETLRNYAIINSQNTNLSKEKRMILNDLLKEARTVVIGWLKELVVDFLRPIYRLPLHESMYCTQLRPLSYVYDYSPRTTIYTILSRPWEIHGSPAPHNCKNNELSPLLPDIVNIFRIYEQMQGKIIHIGWWWSEFKKIFNVQLELANEKTLETLEFKDISVRRNDDETEITKKKNEPPSKRTKSTIQSSSSSSSSSSAVPKSLSVESDDEEPLPTNGENSVKHISPTDMGPLERTLLLRFWIAIGALRYHGIIRPSRYRQQDIYIEKCLFNVVDW